MRDLAADKIESGTYEPRESIALAVHWLGEVRKAVGPDVRLSIDFHHRLSVVEGRRVLPESRMPRSHVPRGTDPQRESRGLCGAAADDLDAVRHRRRIQQQVGVPALYLLA